MGKACPSGSRILPHLHHRGSSGCDAKPVAVAMMATSDAADQPKAKRKWSVVKPGGEGERSPGREARGGGAGWWPGDALPGSTRECNAELQQLARRGDVRTVAALLAAMDAGDLKRDVYTYNAAMNAYCKGNGGRSRSMLEGMMEEMRERGIRPSTVTFNTMLKGAAQSADVAWAELLVEDMARGGVERDHITYSTFVNACSVAGNVARAMEALKEMLDSGIRPTESTLTSLIKGCEVKGDVDAAKAAFAHKDDGMSTAVRCSEPRRASATRD